MCSDQAAVISTEVVINIEVVSLMSDQAAVIYTEVVSLMSSERAAVIYIHSKRLLLAFNMFRSTHHITHTLQQSATGFQQVLKHTSHIHSSKVLLAFNRYRSTHHTYTPAKCYRLSTGAEAHITHTPQQSATGFQQIFKHTSHIHFSKVLLAFNRYRSTHHTHTHTNTYIHTCT